MQKVERSGEILVVDDEKACCDAAADMLRLHGYTVHIANSPAEAEALLTNHAVDVVLLDIRMLEVDGLALLGELSALPKSLDAALVIVSALSMPKIRAAAWERGGDAYLAKPYTIEEILGVLDRAMSRADSQGTAPLGQTRAMRARLADLRPPARDRPPSRS
jgi:CheY-like chemotaxis protein